MPDMIFVSMEDWDEIWRRNQFLVSHFAAAYPTSKILFVGLPRNFSHAVRTRDFSRLRVPAVQSIPGYPNVSFLKPWKLFPNSLPGGNDLNDTLFRRAVRHASARLGLRRPVLWLNPHYALHLAGHMNESTLIYDITDDWIELTQSPALRAQTQKQDADLCAAADHVIVCSEQLHRLKRPLTRNLHLVPNGVDTAHYAAVLSGAGPLPPLFNNLPRPILGYTGSIHPDRVDLPLITALAQNFSGSLVLVGPNMLSPADTRALTALGNVHLPGPVPYSDIPSYMRAFDIAITPHRVTPFTESLNPIKLWEYLAAGKPIISTPVAGFRDFPKHVLLAPTAAAFLAAIPTALAEPRTAPLARQAEARNHSWTARVQQILPLLTPTAHTPQLEESLHAA